MSWDIFSKSGIQYLLTKLKVIMMDKRDFVELTKAQYDALPDTKLTDGKYYFLTDVNALTGNIDDTVTTTTDTWSSSKINQLFTSLDLEDLADTNITAPANGDLLQYNGANDEWVESSDVWDTIAQNGAHNLFNEFGLQQGDVLGEGPVIRVSTKLSTDPYVKVGDKIIVRRTQNYTDRLKLSIIYTTKDNVVLGYTGFEVLTPNTDFVYTVQYEGYMRFVFANYDTAASLTTNAVRNNKILVRLGTDPNTDYTPYAPINRDCMSYAANTKLGVHNLVPCNNVTLANNGVTFTVVRDDKGNLQYIVANGTAGTGNSYFQINLSNTFTLPSGRYIASGCVGGSNATYHIQLNDYNNTVNYVNLSDGEQSFDWPTQTGIRWFIRIMAGVRVNNVKFYPMIRRVDDTDPTYSPYAKTNRELTEYTKVSKEDITWNGTYIDSTERYTKLSRMGKIAVFVGGYVKVNTAIPNNTKFATLPVDVTEDLMELAFVGNQKAYMVGARTNHTSNAELYSRESIPTGNYMLVGTILIY